MAHYLLRALDLLSIGVAVLHLPLHWLLEGERKTTKTKYFIYIDKRIALLELLTERHKIRSQFPYLLCKFVALLGSSSQRLFSVFATVSSNKCNL